MLNFYGEMLRMLRNRLYDFVKDICKKGGGGIKSRLYSSYGQRGYSSKGYN